MNTARMISPPLVYRGFGRRTCTSRPRWSPCFKPNTLDCMAGQRKIPSKLPLIWGRGVVASPRSRRPVKSWASGSGQSAHGQTCRFV